MPFRKFGQAYFCEKNWPSNPWIRCLKTTKFVYAYDVVLDLIAKLNVKFQDEITKIS